MVEQYLRLERTRECDYIGLSLQVRASLRALLSAGLLAFSCQTELLHLRSPDAPISEAPGTYISTTTKTLPSTWLWHRLYASALFENYTIEYKR